MIEIALDAMAHGGEAVGRIDGKACFVHGAMPGEKVRVEISDDRGSWARGRLDAVITPAPERIEPPCRHFDACGGCDWQFATYEAQLAWKQSIVASQLDHLGGISQAPVGPTIAPGPQYGYRNRMDFVVADGRPALRARRSHDEVPIVDCLLAAPAVDDLFRRLPNLDGVSRIVLRCGIATGERLIVVHGEPPPGLEMDGAGVAATDGRRTRSITGAPHLHEEVAGVTFRITGTAFFQVNTRGAEVLVELVTAALSDHASGRILDAYAGGGLFALTAAAHGRVTAVESGGLAVRDLEANVAAAGADVEIRRSRLEQTDGRLGRFDAVIVDPPRRGLAKRGVGAVLTAAPDVIAYVSCDPAALARDARMLTEAGYRLDWVQPVDMFPQTHHIESVTRFSRDG